MKSIIFLCQGLTDQAVESLGDRSPLEVSKTPELDILAMESECGLVEANQKPSFAPIEVRVAELLGLIQKGYTLTSGALRALALQLKPKLKSLAFSYDFVTSRDGQVVDVTAGRIPTSQAKTILGSLSAHANFASCQFCLGRGHEHVLILNEIEKEAKGLLADCGQPSEFLNQKSLEREIKKRKSKRLRDILVESSKLLQRNDVNKVRIDLGENPANAAWVSGGGLPVEGAQGESDLLKRVGVMTHRLGMKGVGRLANARVYDARRDPESPIHADRLLFERFDEAFEECDVLVIDLLACYESTRDGDWRQKVAAIENFDSTFIKSLRSKLANQSDIRYLISPLSDSSLEARTADGTRSLYILGGSGIVEAPLANLSERNIMASKARLIKLNELKNKFFN